MDSLTMSQMLQSRRDSLEQALATALQIELGQDLNLVVWPWLYHSSSQPSELVLFPNYSCV